MTNTFDIPYTTGVNKRISICKGNFYLNGSTQYSNVTIFQIIPSAELERFKAWLTEISKPSITDDCINSIEWSAQGRFGEAKLKLGIAYNAMDMALLAVATLWTLDGLVKASEQ